MKILYIVSRPLEINTSASIRNRATIKGLISLGHSIDLVTTEYDQNHKNYDNTILDKKINTTYLKLGGIQGVARIGRKVSFFKPIKKKIYDYLNSIEVYDNLKGIVNHVKTLELEVKNYDLIISSSDPKSSHLFAYELLKFYNLEKTRWIQIWGDPFFSDITRANNKLDNKIKKEEKMLIGAADKVVYVSEITLAEQKNLYPNYSDKMFYSPIPYLEESIYDVKDKTVEDNLKLLYTGDYSDSIRNINPLLKVMDNLTDILTICGDSNLKIVSKGNITVYPRKNLGFIKELENDADILIHLSNKKGSQIPGKIYQYSGTNKSILFILDGEKEKLKKNFGRYNRFVFCDNTKEDIERAINEIKFSKTKVINAPVERYSPERVARDIIALER
ncbi:hypothetical protein CKN99_12765 [Carnobacterium maltaromaticum]|uniref:hypothetical protein n=1 Tax=Carnobacterium maltaromaticum TaxID=2751 RepID=UPI0010719200|nr:hypothetical protein [Carnobacterium maltaromaticum]TFJ24167.1 hypothetical protein CKN90_12725 [Carnobacterium maltaromaticum]TFJ29572.1 hypothetical protein CKN98_12730 [Carnobacterium maltaromaticum]TFJ32710.1 hypothetical protein CKN88_12685 [Carnobacterium maltaromaticum]TFJ34826.1 hypothetical protein CKN99_12765 [Carnobacterium maltaromaticum]TFJ42015.1 hypothetical protein CKN92_12200 [Carnobacterium maltaromaticum]